METFHVPFLMPVHIRFAYAPSVSETNGNYFRLRSERNVRRFFTHSVTLTPPFRLVTLQQQQQQQQQHACTLTQIDN